MSVLFDASALLNTVRAYRDVSLDVLRDNWILTLTIYEVGNALWKELVLLRDVQLDEALYVMASLFRLVKEMKIGEPNDPVTVLKVAQRLKITYYDASYLTASLEKDLTLVTDDKKLIERAEQDKNVLSEIFGKTPKLMRSTELKPP